MKSTSNLLTHITARVLIVDDEEDIRFLITSILSQHGLTVDCAADGAQAYELICANPSKYDIILSDCNMPNVSGPELASAIRKNKKISKQPKFILMTGGIHLNIDSIDQKMINGFIYKPFKKESILEAIHSALDIDQKKDVA